MNPSYGDPTGSGRGRARVPGSPAPVSPASGRARVGRGADDEWAGGPAAVTGRAPAAGRASVGGAHVGSASVGSASVGAARVGAAAGRASVGRASVRPGDGWADPAWTGPGGPGGGPGAGGPPGGPRGLLGRFGRGGNKKIRRRNLIIASLATMIMLAGLGVVVGTYYFDSVPLPQDMGNVTQASMIYYSDGKTPMARLGANRTLVTIDQIPRYVQQAVVSAEDRTFYTNNGVDLKGIVRAAWSNFTGDSGRQGASTITQQYARHVADLTGITYSRKLREAVIAMKINQKFTKDKIMEMYLNTVYFGRGATGIEAAAEAFFNKHAKDLTMAEGMVLASLIKQPEPTSSFPGYDPANSLPAAQGRWDYVRAGMVKLNFITQAQADALKYPTDWVKPGTVKNVGEFGLSNGDTSGDIVNQVVTELKQKAGINDLRNPGGYKVITTINPAMQKDAVAAADRDLKSSPIYGQPSNLMGALVAVQPGTGRVLAYYGGNNPTGWDYAGINYDNSGNIVGGHQPGSSFKAYVLAQILEHGISVNSMWKAISPRYFSTRPKSNPVVNAEGPCSGTCPTSLITATVQSLNTVYYAMTEKLGELTNGDPHTGASVVAEMAAKAGVRNLWDQNGKHYDLSNPNTWSGVFDDNIGIGQFATTVLDQAEGYSTFASGGYETDAHFVEKVYNAAGSVVYGEQVIPKQVLKPSTIADMDYVLKKVVDASAVKADGSDRPGANSLANGRPAAGKTGTQDWNAYVAGTNLEAWFCGYIPQISTAVWIGNKDKHQPIKWYVNGRLNNLYGAGLPGTVWKQFMDAAANDMPIQQFPPAVFAGDANGGELPVMTTPTQNDKNKHPGTSPSCTIAFLCGGGGGQGGGTGTPITATPNPLPSATLPTKR